MWSHICAQGIDGICLDIEMAPGAITGTELQIVRDGFTKLTCELKRKLQVLTPGAALVWAMPLFAASPVRRTAHPKRMSQLVYSTVWYGISYTFAQCVCVLLRTDRVDQATGGATGSRATRTSAWSRPC